jgi:hypothetical protein
VNPTSTRKGRLWKRVLLVLLVLALLISAAAAWVLSLPQFGGRMEGERLARAQANPHYKDGRFANPLPPAAYRFDDAWAIFKGQFFGSEVRVPPSPIPVVAVDAAALKNPPRPSGLRAFWIGHASVYVEIDGLRVLVDPIFSDFASPFASYELGPKRFFKPPIALADLPRIDAVLISHDHYDHLDMPTIRHLAAKGTAFFVPLGIGAHLKRWGVPEAQVHDMEWWQEHTLKGVRLISTPARHYSGRSLSDRNATLWTSCHRQQVRAVRPELHQDRRLRTRRAVVGHPHERRGRSARPWRPAREAALSGALGNIQSRLPRLG